MRVLVIDDDYLSRMLLYDILSQSGYEVSVGEDGRDGLKKAKAERPALVITDVLMPGMDGFQFLREIRRDSELWDVPVIFYSGTYIDKKDEELAQELGVSRFLTKPKEPSEILAVIEEVLKEKDSGILPPSPIKPIEEPTFLRLYNERLVSKLKGKVTESEYARAFLDSIMEGIGDGVVVIDRQYTILHANTAAASSLGLEKSELIRRKCYELIHRRDAPCEGPQVICPMRIVFGKGETTKVVHTHRDTSGNEQYIEITASPIKDGSGRIIAMAETYRNIMEKQADDDLMKLVKELNDARARLRQMAITDELTGLRNRRYIMERLEEEFQRARRTGRPLSLIMLDIDHFKAVNDTYGHMFGDAVLRTVASRIRDCLRKHDLVGRVGGEEFLVVSPESDVQDAIIVAERIRRVVQSKAIAEGNLEVNVTLSAGVTALSEQDKSPDSVFSRADTALYMAKQEGRNRVRAVNP